MLDGQNDTYEVRYENGTTNYVPASSLENAVKISRESLLNCLPPGFDETALVRPTIVRKVGHCGICGVPVDRQSMITESMYGAPCAICRHCVERRLSCYAMNAADNVAH